MITYVFPGQGSQQKGMGKGLFDEFSDLTAKADRILGYSIKELCLEDPGMVLNQTQYTQPALFVVSALMFLKRVQVTGQKPDYVAGHSLGEYNALFAAGAFDFETGLKLVKKRGELLSGARGGGMAAIVGLSKDQVADFLKRNSLESIDIANHNTPFQIVISGPKAEIERAQVLFKSLKEMQLFLPLNVSGAFHSRYMSEAKANFEHYLSEFQFHPLSIPTISNTQAQPYHDGNIKKNLVEQIDKTVQWVDTIHFLIRQGEMNFEEIGPGTVLTGLIKKIQTSALLT